MTLHIELDHDLEVFLAAAAETRGVAVEQYAQEILRRAIIRKPVSRSSASRQEFRAFLDALESPVPVVPELKDETFSRRFIYGDHD